MTGIVLIDKPSGRTSHDIVNFWRKLAGMKRVGHLGTLDPMATGLLALVVGNATRLAPFFSDNNKTYLAEITFGQTSDTYDAQGNISQTNAAPDSIEAVASALDQFRGCIMQKPPPVSAKKINGVPAYKLARKQLPIDLAPVKVEISRLEIRHVDLPKIELFVICSAGTYVRSLAHDLGQRLGCGALLSKLRRLGSGDFSVDQAKTVDELRRLADKGQLESAVIPAGSLLPHFPAEYFDSVMEARIRQGRDFRTSPFVIRPGAPFVRALSHSGDLIAIGELKIPNLYHPSTVL